MDRLTVLKRANEGSFSVLKLVADWHPEALAGFWTAWLAGAAGWGGGITTCNNVCTEVPARYLK